MKNLSFLAVLVLAAAAWAGADVDLGALKVGDVTTRGTVVYKGTVSTRDIPDDWETLRPLRRTGAGGPGYRSRVPRARKGGIQVGPVR